LVFFCTNKFANLAIPNWSDEDILPDAQRAALLEKRLKSGGVVEAEDDDDKEEESDVWKPHIWRRANVLWISFVVQFMLMVQMEFSYAPPFTNQVYQFIFVFKFLYLFIEVYFLESVCRDTLTYAPMTTAMVVVSNMTTMGASSFTQFVLSFLAGLYLTFIERLYMNPAISQMLSLAPRWQMMLERKLRGNKRMTREAKAQEELEWRRINEEIELESEGVEPMLDAFCDYTVDTTSLLQTPFVYITLQLFYYELQIAQIYGILENQTIIYWAFAFFCIPFQFATDGMLHNCQELIHGWRVYEYVSYQRYRFSVREYRWMLRNPILDESISEGMQSIDLLCFSSQYYFMMTLLSYGMINITFAITIILRQGYNPFEDPVFLPLMGIVFLLGEGLERVLMRLSDIPIRRIGWRGLWITKATEGTVDDDVAAKLAVGEGRQADLEQERLELQALNSERFRHRFLERNRPWILQHLVELLTPRALEEPGPDGRPAIEYVRDVYAELMGMGEGLRKPGEREDISSDEEDELEAARRNWSRKPLTGTSLAIARMWLAKARKRRAFGKLVRGIIDQNKKNVCELCGRTPAKNGVKLVAYLATHGEPDITAIDALIAGFEVQYSVDELDPQLWKAYFKAHAEYCTRCSTCEDAIEQDRLLQTSKVPGPSRPTRPQDISSDEEDEAAIFEPVVVTRSSPEGRMMNKWLLAARKKLGGPFPRPEAKKQMEKYAGKLRQLKMKKILQGPGKGEAKEELREEEKLVLNAATKGLAIRWVRMARAQLEVKFRNKSESLRDDLDKVIADMPEEEDWYYSAAVRIEGQDLKKRGSDLEDDRKTLETEAAVKVHKIEADLEKYVRERNAEIERERKSFEAKLAQQNDRITLDVEVRKTELEKTKEVKKIEFAAIEKRAREELGAAPSEMTQSHRKQLMDIDELIMAEANAMIKYRDDEEKEARIMFDRAEQTKLGEVERRKTAAGDNIARIREDVAVKVKAAEYEWQTRASKWLIMAKRKVAVKKKEDEDAKAGKKNRRR